MKVLQVSDPKGTISQNSNIIRDLLKVCNHVTNKNMLEKVVEKIKDKNDKREI